jgi:hypothetical protein
MGFDERSISLYAAEIQQVWLWKKTEGPFASCKDYHADAASWTPSPADAPTRSEWAPPLEEING